MLPAIKVVLGRPARRSNGARSTFCFFRTASVSLAAMPVTVGRACRRLSSVTSTLPSQKLGQSNNRWLKISRGPTLGLLPGWSAEFEGRSRTRGIISPCPQRADDLSRSSSWRLRRSARLSRSSPHAPPKMVIRRVVHRQCDARHSRAPRHVQRRHNNTIQGFVKGTSHHGLLIITLRSSFWSYLLNCLTTQDVSELTSACQSSTIG